MNRSYLQWAGGKGKLLPQLLSVLETNKKSLFIEPFVGAGNVALNFECDQYVLGDLNEDLINSHKIVCSEHYQDYVEKCREVFSQGFDSYYKLREVFNDTSDILERAILFQYLNKHGFNGLCRYNKKGVFNVPRGSIPKSGQKEIPEKQLEIFHGKFDPEDFRVSSFEDLMSYKDALIYCDPPYVPLSTSSFNYTQGGFGYTDQVKLRDLARESSSTVIISNHSTSVTKDLYKDADEFYEFDVQRTISCDGKNRVRVKECLVVYKGTGGK